MSNQPTTEETGKKDAESTILPLETVEEQKADVSQAEVVENPPTQKLDYSTLVKLVQQLGSILVAIGTIISLGGYVVVHSYLWAITDLQPYSILPSQYLIAGSGFLIFVATLITFLLIVFRMNIAILTIFAFGVFLLLVILTSRSNSVLIDSFFVLLTPLSYGGVIIYTLRMIYSFLPIVESQK